jgi:hypothetical protein
MRLTSDRRIHANRVEDPVVRAIVRFMSTTMPDEIEAVADYLGASADSRAIGPLASRLADSRVHDDPDLENAVCSSLVSLGAMRQHGNLNYVFVDPDRLDSLARYALRRLSSIIPRRYFQVS